MRLSESEWVTVTIFHQSLLQEVMFLRVISSQFLFRLGYRLAYENGSILVK